MSVTVVAKSLSIYEWPAVTVTPLPTPAVTTLHLSHPSREYVTVGKRVEGKILFFKSHVTAGCVSFFFHFFLAFVEEPESARKADETAAGCGCRMDNEGHQRSGDILLRLR